MRVAPINIVDTLFHSALSVEQSYEFDTYRLISSLYRSVVKNLSTCIYSLHTHTLIHSHFSFCSVYFIQFTTSSCECVFNFVSVFFSSQIRLFEFFPAPRLFCVLFRVQQKKISEVFVFRASTQTHTKVKERRRTINKRLKR